MVERHQALIERIQALTGLNRRACACVATSLEEINQDEDWSAEDIVREAEELGYEFDTPEPVEANEPASFAPEISLDPATVLSEVYMVCPRVMCSELPRLGRAPTELQEHIEELDLPDDVKALLVKVDLMEGKATLWLWDEANQVDRPVGPIDLERYSSGQELHEAIETLLRRLPKVLASDHN